MLLPPDTRVDIWGSHGREQLLADGSYKLFALDSVQQATLHHVVREMEAMGSGNPGIKAVIGSRALADLRACHAGRDSRPAAVGI